MIPGRYFIRYDFGDADGVTGWLLLKDGIVLSKHGSWDEAVKAIGVGK